MKGVGCGGVGDDGIVVGGYWLLVMLLLILVVLGNANILGVGID